jgi:molybdopterin synthase catalytic subunit
MRPVSDTGTDRSGTSGGYTEIVDPAQAATVGLAVDDQSSPNRDQGSPDRYRRTDDALDPVAIASLLARSSTGGLTTFTGLVRDHNAGKRVLWIDYEAYAPLARTVFARIGAEARERWPGAELAIHHRMGRVSIGEASVVVVAGSAHRAEAFSACRFAIERVKQIAPVWKHEYFVGGDVWVEGATADPDDEAALRTAVERACT